MAAVAGQLAAGQVKFTGTIGGMVLHMTLGIFGIWVLAIAAP